MTGRLALSSLTHFYMGLYENILDLENIRYAYFELAEKLEEKNKMQSYRGLDGVYFCDTEAVSENIFSEIQKELRSLASPAPVLNIAIPKKHVHEVRNIYMYSLHDRIKAQAIYRVVEPVFEKAYSDFLFSYRLTKPSYYAARSVARRYQRKRSEDYVLVGDFRNYTDSIDHELLLKNVGRLGFSQEVMNLLKLFVSVRVFNRTEVSASFGVKQGVPLIALFANIFLNDMDFDIGGKVQFFRRVGDDFIAFDPSYEKLSLMKEKIEQVAKDKKLEVVIKLCKASECFDFLGYSFSEGLISIKDTSLKKIQQKWKRQLKYTKANVNEKKRRLRSLCYSREKNCFHYDFVQVVKQYSFVSDKAQMQKLSEYFFKLVTRYFFDSYTPKLHRDTQNLVKDIKLPSLNTYFVKIHSGEKKYSDFVI